MSKLAELLQRPPQRNTALGVAANSANSANPVAATTSSAAEISSISKISRWSKSETHLAPSLQRRLRAHAERWEYSPDELADLLEWACRDPNGWLWYVGRAEQRAALAAQAAELAGSGLSDQAIADRLRIDLAEARKLLLIDPACKDVAHLFLVQAS